ncbi:MAG: PCRF domain-containing protein, partial [Firmicutes bacterium]|nr:PCRF domain-containing protein [Bacillota bacterium]
MADLNIEVEIPGFWDDLARATETMKNKKALENKLGEYDQCAELLEEIELSMEMAAEADDDELAQEAVQNFGKLETLLEELNIKNLLTGEYDTNNAILSIHPGAGGLDAQDWG